MDHALYNGLRELAASAFPKRCANCGRVYASAEDYLRETRPPAVTHSGLKQATDDDGSVIVEVFRNCPCGSTLLDFFNDRRDRSDAGQQRRERFLRLVGYLVANGIDRPLARSELLKVLHGQSSEVLARFLLPDFNLPSSE